MQMLSSSYPKRDRVFYNSLRQPTEQFLTDLHSRINNGEGWIGPLENEVDLVVLFTAHHILWRKEKARNSHLKTLELMNDQPIEFIQQEVILLLQALLFQHRKYNYSKYLDIVKQKCSDHVGIVDRCLTKL